MKPNALVALILIIGSLALVPAAEAKSKAKSAGTADAGPFVNFGGEEQLKNVNADIQALCGERRYEKALQLANSAVTLAEKEFGAEHVETAKALNNRAWLEQTLGDYAASRADFESALKIYERNYGTDGPQLATTLSNLALLLAFQGDNDAALPLLQRVLMMQEIVLGANHKELAPTLNNLAAVLNSLGKSDESRAMLERALALQADSDVATRAQTLNNLAMLSQKSGNLLQAKQYLETIVELRHDAIEAKNPDTIEILNNLAMITYATGSSETALKLLDQAMVIAGQGLGEQHIDYATTLSNRAAIYFSLGKTKEAQRDFLTVSNVIQQHIDNVLPSLSFAEQRAFLSKKVPATISNLLSTTTNADETKIAYDRIFRWKGLLIESIRWQTLISKQLNASNCPPELAELTAVRRDIGNLFHQSGTLQFSDWKQQFEQLSKKKEQLERIVLGKLGRNEMRDRLASMSLSQFLALLNEDELLADVYLYDKLIKNERIRHYAVVFATKSGDMALVDLGGAQAIDRAIEGWRKAVLERRDATGYLLEVRHRVFDPMNAVRTSFGKKKVFYSPDGELSNFPPGVVIVDDKSGVELAQLDSPRQLAQLRSGTTASIAAPHRSEMLVVGGVNFGKKSSGDAVELSFPPLPGTVKEAQAVMAIGTTNNMGTNYLCGQGVTKASLLSAFSKADYAHLATHGFFADEGWAIQEFRLKMSGSDESVGCDKQLARNPLLESALVLSAPPGKDRPELLTAEDLIGADLSRCKFVAMSACETGLGAQVAAQGVLGLRASLVASGARTLLMSLWRVPDGATVMLMERFYENLLTKHEPPAVALRNAQRHVRDDAPLQAYQQPVNWGAWVLVGEGW